MYSAQFSCLELRIAKNGNPEGLAFSHCMLVQASRAWTRRLGLQPLVMQQEERAAERSTPRADQADAALGSRRLASQADPTRC